MQAAVDAEAQNDDDATSDAGSQESAEDARGPSVAAHPRAALHVARAKGWGGLLGFALAGWLSLPTCPLATAGLRALVAGVVCYLAGWAGAVFVWRHLVMLQYSGARAAARGPSPSPASAPARGGTPAYAPRFAAPAEGPRLTARQDAPQEAEPTDAEPAKPAAEYRRANVRVQAQRPVIAWVGADREEVLTYTIDLSAGGMLVAGLEELEAGELFEFELTLDPEDPPVAGAATVVRTNPEGSCAVAFKSIGGDDERRLVKYVFDYQRGGQTAA